MCSYMPHIAIKMKCQFIFLFILPYMDKQSDGASISQHEEYHMSIHGHSHHHGDPFSRQNSTERPLEAYHGYDHDRQVFLTARHNEPSLDILERDPGYPYQEVRNYLQNNPVLRDYFMAAAPQIGNRIAGGSNAAESSGESLCRTRNYKLFYPQRLRNVNNMWRTIVNIEKEYEQGVEVKSCESEGMCNRLDSASIPFGFTSYCAQEFISKELMVYNSSTAFDLFRFPSCCVCKIRRT